MPEAVNPAASDPLPSFITAPGDTDILMVVMAVVLAAATFGFGILFLRLHTLPERVAHKSQKIQFEIVAVLGLISLFTHMHIFWIIGLLLALIEIPDFGGMLGRIAGSVERLADVESSEREALRTERTEGAEAQRRPEPIKEMVGQASVRHLAKELDRA